jgi:hypothetical protein
VSTILKSGNFVDMLTAITPPPLLSEGDLSALNLANTNLVQGKRKLFPGLEKSGRRPEIEWGTLSSDYEANTEGVLSIVRAIKTGEVAELDLANNNFGGAISDSTKASNGICDILKELEENDTLESLSLCGNNLNSGKNEPVEALARILKDNSKLTTIDIAGNNLDANHMGVINAAIKKNKTLESINLLRNFIPVELAKELVIIMQTKPKLRTLCGLKGDEIGLNFAGQGLGAADAVLIVNDIIQANWVLKELVLKNNKLMNKESGKALSDLLTQHPSIRVLDLSKNGRVEPPVSFQGDADPGTEEFVSSFLIGLKANSTLVSANLQGNNINVSQALALATAFRKHPTLRSLHGQVGGENQKDMKISEVGAAGAIMLAPEIEAGWYGVLACPDMEDWFPFEATSRQKSRRKSFVAALSNALKTPPISPSQSPTKVASRSFLTVGAASPTRKTGRRKSRRASTDMMGMTVTMTGAQLKTIGEGHAASSPKAELFITIPTSPKTGRTDARRASTGTMDMTDAQLKTIGEGHAASSPKAERMCKRCTRPENEHKHTVHPSMIVFVLFKIPHSPPHLSRTRCKG